MTGSPAEKAGIKEDDIILEIDGKKLDPEVSFASIIRAKSVGDIVTLRILHKGENRNIRIPLGQYSGY